MGLGGSRAAASPLRSRGFPRALAVHAATGIVEPEFFTGRFQVQAQHFAASRPAVLGDQLVLAVDQPEPAQEDPRQGLLPRIYMKYSWTLSTSR